MNIRPWGYYPDYSYDKVTMQFNNIRWRNTGKIKDRKLFWHSYTGEWSFFVPDFLKFQGKALNG